jgi:Flp pilus assembly protein TadD
MKRAIPSLVFALISIAAGPPSTQEVEAQVRQGNYAQAETMMREVVAARPDSARAHHVYAEILAHNRNLAQAAEEAQRARCVTPR